VGTRPHDYESCTGCERRRSAVKLEQGRPGNRADWWHWVSRGSPGVCAIVDAWWTSSARRFACQQTGNVRGLGQLPSVAQSRRSRGTSVTGGLSRSRDAVVRRGRVRRQVPAGTDELHRNRWSQVEPPVRIRSNKTRADQLGLARVGPAALTPMDGTSGGRAVAVSYLSGCCSRCRLRRRYGRLSSCGRPRRTTR
jgi:hypothetical protein